MLRFCAQQNYQVILLETPTSNRFKQQRIPEVLHRKDSILSLITSKYDVHYTPEEATKQYSIKDRRDDNHLGPQGAEKFTKRLNTLLEELE